ncbi:MAG: glycosyltransferase family 2 protein [Dermatophilaceae bacterium]
MTPRVSVVVPSYNNAGFIELTVESILASTFTDFELLIADHRSTDGTWQALQRYAGLPRVRIWQTAPGGGAAANWRAVTDAAGGEFLKLVCGDDLIYPTCLRDQVDAMDAHPQVTLVCARRDLIDAHGTIVLGGRGMARISGYHPGRNAVRRSVVTGTNIFGEPASVLIRRAVLDQVGGWWSEFPYVIDQATYTQVLLRGDLYAVDKSLAAFRISDHQWSVELAEEQARQVVAFHSALAQRTPGLLSGTDLRRGWLMAVAIGRARRLVYRGLRRRM